MPVPVIFSQVDVRSLKELMWGGIHSVPQPGGAPPSPDTVLEFQASDIFPACDRYLGVHAFHGSWGPTCILHENSPCFPASPLMPGTHPVSQPCLQDVLRTVPERNPAGRLEDLSGEGWGTWLGWLGGLLSWQCVWHVLVIHVVRRSAAQPCDECTWPSNQPTPQLQSQPILNQPPLPLQCTCASSACCTWPSTQPAQLPSQPILHPSLQCTSASSACCTWPTSTAWSSAPCRSWTACSSQTCPRTSGTSDGCWLARGSTSICRCRHPLLAAQPLRSHGQRRRHRHLRRGTAIWMAAGQLGKLPVAPSCLTACCWLSCPCCRHDTPEQIDSHAV